MIVPLPEFSVASPPSIDAAIAAWREHSASAYLAGGTDLLVQMRHGLANPKTLIDLSAIEELKGFEVSDAGVRIGAGVTVASLARAPAAQHYRAVTEAALAIAGPGHRALGTVGGNLCLDTRCLYYNQSEWWRRSNGYCLKLRGDICHVAPQGRRCHAAFTGDLAPALLALGAEVEIAAATGRRRTLLGELYVEDGGAHLRRAPEEIIVAVHLPPDPPRSTYGKVRTRGAIDYPLAGVAVALEARKGVVQRLRIALTGTNSRPFVLAGTDALLGSRLDDGVLDQVDRLVQKQVQPMRTTLASGQYRRLAAAAVARRLVEALGTGVP